MADVNVYYHKQTNTWWTNSELDGIELTDYINNNMTGLGTVELDTNDKTQIGSSGIQEVHGIFIPNHIKTMSGISQTLEENGLDDSQKVNKRQIKRMLK